MRHLRRPPRMDEPNLFSPPMALPAWQSLPPEVRQQIQALLVQILHPSRKAVDAQSLPTEVADE